MIDLRKIAIIFIIAILFSIFVFTFVDAVNPEPDRTEFCTDFGERPRPLFEQKPNVKCPDIGPTKEEHKQCNNNLGYIQYEYDSTGCVESYECTCEAGLKDLVDKKNLIDFIVFTIFALIAILVGLFLPYEKNTLNEWVGTGFMLGGLITLFIGTARFFGDLARPLRPVVILIELIVVIYIAYKKLGNLKHKK